MDDSDRQMTGNMLEGPTFRVEYKVGNPNTVEPMTSTSEYITSAGTALTMTV